MQVDRLMISRIERVELYVRTDFKTSGYNDNDITTKTVGERCVKYVGHSDPRPTICEGLSAGLFCGFCHIGCISLCIA